MTDTRTKDQWWSDPIANTAAVLTSLSENTGSSHNEESRCQIVEADTKLTIDEEQILALAEAIYSGRPLTREQAQLKEHLITSTEHRRIYDECMALIRLGPEPQLPEAISVPQFDLSFLPQSDATTVGAAAASAAADRKVWRNWTLDSVGRLVVEFSQQLLDSLQPPPQLAYAKSGPSSLFKLSIDDYDDLSVKIEAAQNRRAESSCDLAVQVDIPSRGPLQLGGIQVNVRRGDQLLESIETDAFGNAVVQGVKRTDLPKLVFVVDPTHSK